MCLNETCSKSEKVNMSDAHSVKICLKTRCFIAIAFQLSFRICHYEQARKSGGTVIE